MFSRLRFCWRVINSKALGTSPCLTEQDYALIDMLFEPNEMIIHILGGLDMNTDLRAGLDGSVKPSQGALGRVGPGHEKAADLDRSAWF